MTIAINNPIVAQEIANTWANTYVPQLNSGINYSAQTQPRSPENPFNDYFYPNSTNGGVVSPLSPDIGSAGDTISASRMNSAFLSGSGGLAQWGSIRNCTFRYTVTGGGSTDYSGLAYLSNNYRILPQLSGPQQPVSGATITATSTSAPYGVTNFLQNLYDSWEASVKNNNVGVLEVTVCHSSCHSSCHGSRGRR